MLANLLEKTDETAKEQKAVEKAKEQPLVNGAEKVNGKKRPNEDEDEEIPSKKIVLEKQNGIKSETPPAAEETGSNDKTGSSPKPVILPAKNEPQVNGVNSPSKSSHPFLCEWQNCLESFKTPKQVENHAIKVHCGSNDKNNSDEDLPCLWARCDGMKRKRFSLMTHIQDRHCHPQLMKLMAVRRVQMAATGKSEVPLPPAPPAHPGYAPNAALHAIKRHHAEFAAPKAQAVSIHTY